jgi:hypothetical protein
MILRSKAPEGASFSSQIVLDFTLRSDLRNVMLKIDHLILQTRKRKKRVAKTYLSWHANRGPFPPARGIVLVLLVHT